MNRRDTLGNLDQIAKLLESGEEPSIRGFALPEEKPLDQFLVGPSMVTSIGSLSDLSAEVVKFYMLVAGVRTTAIFAAKGLYDQLPPRTRGRIIKQERDVLAVALDLGRDLVSKLRSAA
jgi:hypothetical protein